MHNKENTPLSRLIAGISKAYKDKTRDGLSRGHITSSELSTIGSERGLTLVGRGRECAVYRLTDHLPQYLVLAIYFETLPTEDVLTNFYLNKIYSTLFPYNFARVLKVFSNQQHGYCVQIRNRVYPDTSHDNRVKNKLNYPFARVEEMCDAYGVPLPIDQAGAGNFILTRDAEVYVDQIRLPGTHLDPSLFTSWTRNTIWLGREVGLTDDKLKSIANMFTRIGILNSITDTIVTNNLL